MSAERISAIPGLEVVIPQGAMYLMVGIKINDFKDIKSDLDFTEKLVSEESVLCLPGSVSKSTTVVTYLQCFRFPNYFRIVFTAPKEQLETAYARLRAFCERHHI